MPGRDSRGATVGVSLRDLVIHALEGLRAHDGAGFDKPKSKYNFRASLDYGACEMAPWVKLPIRMPEDQNLIPWKLHGGRREHTPSNCPLTSTHELQHMWAYRQTDR